MSQHTPQGSEPRERQPLAPQERANEKGATAAERLLWTPTEGQDLTKSYFPLSDNSETSDSD
jgi:hypothetical protein